MLLGITKNKINNSHDLQVLTKFDLKKATWCGNSIQKVIHNIMKVDNN